MKKNYKAWEINFPDKPENLDLLQRVNFCLTLGILAPSTHNSQPWLIKFLSHNELLVYVNESRLLPEADPSGRELAQGLGCLIENIAIAANQLHLQTNFVEKFNEDVSKTSILISFQDNQTEYSLDQEVEKKMYHAIPNRVNARLLFDSTRQLSDLIINQTKRINKWPEELEVLIFTNTSEKRYLAKITGEAVYVAQSKKSFRKEFAKLVHNNITKSNFGMPAISFGLPLLPSFAAPFIFRNFDVSRLLQKVNESAMNACSAILLITSKNNTTKSWYYVGRFFERISLFLTSEAINVSVHIAAAEIDKYSAKLIEHFRLQNRPQMIFRVGYSDKKAMHTPRAPLEDFLVK